jgi:hypothetical protein
LSCFGWSLERNPRRWEGEGMGEEVEEWGGAACKGSEDPGTESGWLLGLQGSFVSSSRASVGNARAYMRLVEAGASNELMDGRKVAAC